MSVAEFDSRLAIEDAAAEADYRTARQRDGNAEQRQEALAPGFAPAGAAIVRFRSGVLDGKA